MEKHDIYRKYEKALIYETDYIRKTFEMYFGLNNSLIDHKVAKSIGPIFFALACNSFREVAITRLAKLYEDNSQVISIFKYLEYIEQNAQAICANKKTELRTLAIGNKLKLKEEYGYKLKQLKMVRDKLLAHNSKQYFGEEDIWKDAGLLISDYRFLIDLPYEIINDFMVLLRDTSPMKGAVGGENDIEMIMMLLEIGKKTWIEEAP